MGFIAWIVVGLVAGCLAGHVMEYCARGIDLDFVIGIIGALLGGWIFGFIGIGQDSRMIGSMVAALAGAVILVWITRLHPV
jgi:uncharacterized membrane protein YeaQ/YmgE (transglycosylase-associated protein family)